MSTTLTEAERVTLVNALVAAQVSATGVTSAAFSEPGSDFERAAVRYIDKHGLGVAVGALLAAREAAAAQTIKELQDAYQEAIGVPPAQHQRERMERMASDLEAALAAAQAVRDQVEAVAEQWEATSVNDHDGPCRDDEDCALCCAQDLRAALRSGAGS